MSIESDLNTFRDLALEEQIKIPYYLDKHGNYNQIYDNLDPLISDIVGNNKMTLTGEVYTLETDSSQRYLNRCSELSKNEITYGQNYGVYISSRYNIDPNIFTDDKRLLVGYFSVAITVEGMFANYSEKGHKYYNFAPVETSHVCVPELLIPESDILPESDDRIAIYIDDAVLNDPKNFGDLVTIFNKLSKRPNSELEIDYYLNYLNYILPLDEYSARLTSTSFVYDARDGTYTDTIDPESTFFSAELLPSNFEYIMGLNALCISIDVISVHNQYDRYYVPIDAIQDLTLTHLT